MTRNGSFKVQTWRLNLSPSCPVNVAFKLELKGFLKYHCSHETQNVLSLRPKKIQGNTAH